MWQYGPGAQITRNATTLLGTLFGAFQEIRDPTLQIYPHLEQPSFLAQLTRDGRVAKEVGRAGLHDRCEAEGLQSSVELAVRADDEPLYPLRPAPRLDLGDERVGDHDLRRANGARPSICRIALWRGSLWMPSIIAAGAAATVGSRSCCTKMAQIARVYLYPCFTDFFTRPVV